MFSSFDPMWFNLCYKNTIMLLLPMFFITSTFWLIMNNIYSLLMPIKTYIITQTLSTKMKTMKGASMTISTLFPMIIFINMVGMSPYLFSVTSHIIFTLSLGLPLWMSMIIMSISHSTKKTIAHFLPDGAPNWLNPFLVLIETISITVRPVTLSFRLAANMTAGHVVLSLMTSFSVTKSLTVLAITIIMSMMYIAFELSICLIQAYIFSLLLTLYSNDHS